MVNSAGTEAGTFVAMSDVVYDQASRGINNNIFEEIDTAQRFDGEDMEMANK